MHPFFWIFIHLVQCIRVHLAVICSVHSCTSCSHLFSAFLYILQSFVQCILVHLAVICSVHSCISFSHFIMNFFTSAICLDESSLVDSEQWLKQAEEGGDGVEATPKPLPQPLQLLQALLKHLPEVEQAGGVRAIPFMQVRGLLPPLIYTHTPQKIKYIYIGHCVLSLHFLYHFLLVPSLQLVYSLTTHLENSAVDRSVLHFVLKIFISRLNFNVEAS